MNNRNYVLKSAQALKSKADYLKEPNCFKEMENKSLKHPYFLEIYNTPHIKVSNNDHKLIAYNIYGKQGKEQSETFIKNLTKRIWNDIYLNTEFDPTNFNSKIFHPDTDW